MGRSRRDTDEDGSTAKAATRAAAARLKSNRRALPKLSRVGCSLAHGPLETNEKILSFSKLPIA